MTKSTKITIWILLCIMFLIIGFLLFQNQLRKSQHKKICCNNTCFDIEIADNDESRQLWLMYREFLSDDKWMLFIFDEMWAYSFRMKNTLIPLAWIRLDSDLHIVDIIQMDPCKTEKCQSYKPQSEAQYVLEINQWLISEKWLLHIWDSCKLINS